MTRWGIYLTPHGQAFDSDGKPLKKYYFNGRLAYRTGDHTFRLCARMLWLTFVGDVGKNVIDSADPRHPTVNNIVKLRRGMTLNRDPLPRDPDKLASWRERAAKRAWAALDEILQ